MITLHPNLVSTLYSLRAITLWSTNTNKKGLLALTLVSILHLTSIDFAAAQSDPRTNPLFQIEDLRTAFQGVFTVDYNNPSSSEKATTAYAKGRVAYDAENNSIFVDLHNHEDRIMEFSVPDTLATFSGSPEVLGELPVADVLQNDVTPLTRSVTGNTQRIDSLGAMAMIDGELFIQGYEFYDNTNESDKHTTLILRDPSDLTGSKVDGFFSMQGGARTVNYISPIPAQWQTLLQGDYLAGNGAGLAINGRLSLGPSLYSFNHNDFDNKTSGIIATKEWQSYDLEHALSTSIYTEHCSPANKCWDAYNKTGTASGFAVGESNNLWTESSAAWFGFIPAGTRTFVVLGKSGMHKSGGGYKAQQLQDDGTFKECFGPCAFRHDDNYNYYWLYDLNEILSSQNVYDVIPYDYGEFDNRFGDGGRDTGFTSGGTYDPITGKLVLSMASGSSIKGQNDPTSAAALIAIYQLGIAPPSPPSNISIEAISISVQ